MIPAASQSIEVAVLRQGATVASVTINRPQTEGCIDDIAAAEAVLRATAYPKAGAQGVPQATAEITITIVAGETRLYPLTLESAIRHVEITPNPASVIEGESIQLTATAMDGDGNIVLVPAASGFTWSIMEGASYIALDAAGTVSGRAEGQAAVSAVENESSVAGVAAVIVGKEHDLTYFCMSVFSPEFERSVVVKAHYAISTDTWGEFSLVYEDPTYRCGSVHGGVIDNSIFLFFDRRDSNAAFHDLGYIRSFDIDGSHWSEFVSVDTGLPVFAAHGHFIHLQGTDTYFQPYYGWDLIDDTWIHSIKLFRSDDRGQHWVDGPTVYEGPVGFVEPSGVCVGDNRILVLVRNEHSGSIWRFVSSDGGESWSDPEDIERGQMSICVPDIAFDGVQSVLLAYLDRGKTELELAYADANTAFAEPCAYSYGTSTPSTTEPGYPSVCPIGPNTFYVVWSEEEGGDGRNCDTIGGIVTVPLNTDPFADFRKVIDTPYKEAYGVLLDTRD